jgi:hypothetical protein
MAANEADMWRWRRNLNVEASKSWPKAVSESVA